ncbi:hypothetical protein E6O75_ATG06013 [Venturia nashicola]|uniref:Uncharacterized protein n=1 Tax=Venturia nashicola TaxID=86259 RepID=A0A4Z1NS29_9PEZI|nr:hypothetical protein E6O75_ATG06013 [Venturia nashicola]
MELSITSTPNNLDDPNGGYQTHQSRSKWSKLVSSGGARYSSVRHGAQRNGTQDMLSMGPVALPASRLNLPSLPHTNPQRSSLDPLLTVAHITFSLPSPSQTTRDRLSYSRNVSFNKHTSRTSHRVDRKVRF